MHAELVRHRHTSEMRKTLNDTLNLPLAKTPVDRDYLRRQEPNLFDDLWADAATRVLVLHEGKALLRAEDGHLVGLDYKTTEEVPSALVRAYLGKAQVVKGLGESPLVLAVVGDNSANQIQPDAANWHQLRRTGSGLSELDAAVYAQGLALANWHETHQHCAQCGSLSIVEQGGWVRRCMKDGKELFPRTDPAIIVSVVDADDRILLGSQGAWEENRWSVLAGFVEPGESLTQAVVREVFEEAGVVVVEPEYLGSQAWPYPFSLMVGFTARVAADYDLASVTPDGIEIEKLRWFTRQELANEAANLFLPGKVSIARALIEHWYGGQLITASELS